MALLPPCLPTRGPTPRNPNSSQICLPWHWGLVEKGAVWPCVGLVSIARHTARLLTAEGRLQLTAVQGCGDTAVQQLLLHGRVPLFAAVPTSPHPGGGSWGSLAVCLAMLAEDRLSVHPSNSRSLSQAAAEPELLPHSLFVASDRLCHSSC